MGAARAYEALARETGESKYLFNAGMAREAAGDLSQAVLWWEKYLYTGTGTAEDEALLRTKLAAARTRLIECGIRLVPPPPPEELLALQLTRDGAGRDPLVLDASRLAVPVQLEAGEWTVVLSGPHGATTAHWVVDRAGASEFVLAVPVATPVTPTPVTPTPVTLAPRPLTLSPELPASQRPLDRDARTRLGLGLGLGGAGLVLVGAGAIVTSRATVDLAVLRDAGEASRCTTAATCDAASAAALQLSSGLAVIGAGVGSGVAAATAGSRARDRALVVEAGVGAALFTAGLVWYLAEIYSPSYTLSHRAREHVAATSLGAGAGLLGGAAIGLLTRSLVRRRGPRAHALQPIFLRNGAALSWRVHF